MVKVDKIRTVRVLPASELLHDETGATAIEYSLIASAIAFVIVMTVGLIGEHVFGMFADVAAGFG